MSNGAADARSCGRPVKNICSRRKIVISRLLDLDGGSTRWQSDNGRIVGICDLPPHPNSLLMFGVMRAGRPRTSAAKLWCPFLVMAPGTFQLGPTHPSLYPLRAHSRSSRQERVSGMDESFDRCQTQPLWPTRRTQLYCMYIQLNKLAYFSVNARVFPCACGWVGPKHLTARGFAFDVVQFREQEGRFDCPKSSSGARFLTHCFVRLRLIEIGNEHDCCHGQDCVRFVHNSGTVFAVRVKTRSCPWRVLRSSPRSRPPLAACNPPGQFDFGCR